MYKPASDACNSPNGQTPIPASAFAQSQAVAAAVDAAIRAGNAAVYGGCTDPMSYMPLGMNVVVDVSRTPITIKSGTNPRPSAAPAVLCDFDAPPLMIPFAAGFPVPPTVPPQTVPRQSPAAMPQAPSSTPAQGRAPSYSNLCWALRNGLVTASQFDPTELMNLQLKCSQMGYAGSCPPPADVALYLSQNSGKLPHVSVSQSQIDAIQRVDLSGVRCGQTPAGMGDLPQWGDAWVPTAASSAVSGIVDLVKANPLIALGVAGGALLLLMGGKKGRRG
jgi:hypothetical protein